MRRLALTGSFILLVAALFGLWRWRFERDPNFSMVGLGDLRQGTSAVPGVAWPGPVSDPKLRLRVSGENPRVLARMELPGISAPISFLHVTYRLSARDLRMGREIWHDGRCITEWHSPAGGDWENDHFASVRFDQTGTTRSIVLRPEATAAIPALRVEHLGATGEMNLEAFQATVLRERALWRFGRWGLMAAWVAWIMAWIGPVGASRYVRPLLAAAICLLMGIYFVVPGPWKILHPLVAPFQIGPETGNPGTASGSRAPPALSLQSASPLESVGEIPVQGDLTLRIKHYASKARPLLHVLLLAGPTLVLACIIGRRRSIPLMILMALSIEAAQSAFGYGFDLLDVFDLLCDAGGIALGVWGYSRLVRFLKLEEPGGSGLLRRTVSSARPGNRHLSR